MFTTVLRKVCSAFIFLLPTASFFISGCSQKVVSSRASYPRNAAASIVTININTANIEELQRLPQIGPRVAAKIIEHRERYGAFREPEHLLIVDGISEGRFHKLRPYISTD